MNLETNILIDHEPAWMPEELRGRAWAFKYRYSRAERNVYRKRRRIPVSQWAERHRSITMGAVQGPWRNSTTPYLAGIMDASFFPSVETVIICAADQVGKSECVNNCIGYAIDRAPGPVLYVYPDEQTAKENSRDRILPMIESSPRLKSYLSGQMDDAASMRINMIHMPIYMAWARSAARLANKPIKYIVFDETDKYPDTAGKREASPIRKGEKRLRTYRHSRKTWKLSTPTIEAGPIWQSLTEEAEAIFDFHVKCPMCGGMQRMLFNFIKWPADTRDPKKVELEDLARYECKDCGSMWDDHLRNLAVQSGVWTLRDTDQELISYLKENEPKRIGFHIPSWISRFVGLSEVAAAFLRGLGDKNELKDFLNSHAAEPWKDYTAEREESRILALRDERPSGLVPSGGVISCLTAGVDTQDKGFWYEIRAWGYWKAEQFVAPESWQIRAGFVDTFESLWSVLSEVYYDVDEREYTVRLVIQDAMGHRTTEVYEFARFHRNFVYPFKGMAHVDGVTRKTTIEKYPGTNRTIPGGIRLIHGDVTVFKNQLAEKLEISGADPGAWHLHAEATEDWARQMCAERIDDKTNLWVCPETRANHAWDCSVYNLVAVWELRNQIRKPQVRLNMSKDPKAESEKASWIKSGGGWFKR